MLSSCVRVRCNFLMSCEYESRMYIVQAVSARRTALANQTEAEKIAEDEKRWAKEEKERMRREADEENERISKEKARIKANAGLALENEAARSGSTVTRAQFAAFIEHIEAMMERGEVYDDAEDFSDAAKAFIELRVVQPPGNPYAR